MAKNHALLEFLLGTLTGALQSIGESKLVDVLQQLHDKDAERYKAAILGGKALVVALAPLVDGTGTKIDDALLNALGDAIETSASNNGITLP